MRRIEDLSAELSVVTDRIVNDGSESLPHHITKYLETLEDLCDVDKMSIIVIIKDKVLLKIRKINAVNTLAVLVREYEQELARKKGKEGRAIIAEEWILKKGPVTIVGLSGICTGTITGITDKNVLFKDENGKSHRKAVDTFKRQYAGIQG